MNPIPMLHGIDHGGEMTVAHSPGHGGRGSRGGYVPPPPELRSHQRLADLLPPRRALGGEQQVRLFAKMDDSLTDRGPVLFCAGDLRLAQMPAVAIVGTREVSDEGAARARRLARELAAAGVVVVSGLARGVDSAAHGAALQADGRTIAVIGTPLDKAYPAENKRLQEQIYREHLLVSPFADGTFVQKHFFPQRNRVMAAMSDATVIVEASDTSGTLHQAAECTRLGRWLFIARSLMNDANVTWPAKFMAYSRTRVLERTEDVLSAIGA
jgi:DNA processing protein